VGGGLGPCRRLCIADDHSHLTLDEFRREARQPIKLIVRPTIFDRHVLALDKSFFLQTFLECRHEMHERCGRRATKKANYRYRRLLRPRRDRPRRRTAEQRDERAAPHSITPSAGASRGGGPSRPSVLAFLRLISSSYLVGACTGRSPGFAPLRMRST